MSRLYGQHQHVPFMQTANIFPYSIDKTWDSGCRTILKQERPAANKIDIRQSSAIKFPSKYLNQQNFSQSLICSN